MKVNFGGKIVSLYFLIFTDERLKEVTELTDEYGLDLVEINSTNEGYHLYSIEEQPNPLKDPDPNNFLGLLAREQQDLWLCAFGDDPDGEPAIAFCEKEMVRA